MSLNAKEQNIFSAKIHALEKYFIKIYGIDQMPKYTIKYIEPETNESYNMKILNNTSPITLCVSKLLLFKKNYDYKSTVIHEFTHICDYSTLLLDYNEKKRSNVLSLWSEYHATYLQTIYEMGIINQNTNEYSLNKDIPQNLILYWNEFIESCINTFKFSCTTLNWSYLINCYMNYFGAISAFNEFVNNKIKPQNFGFILDDIMQQIFIYISSSDDINDISSDLADFKQKLNNMCVSYIINNTP